MDLNIIIVLIVVGGWIFGRLFDKLKLPSIIGMLCFGLLAGIMLKGKIPSLLDSIEPFIKSFALLIILLRAGLGLKWDNLKKVGITAFLMSFVPCLFEGAALTVAFRFIFNFSWMNSALTAFMIAAVSPAVIVPSMLELQENLPEHKRSITTIILAGASADDVFSITFFTIFLNLSVSQSSDISHTLLSIPSSIIAGILAGYLLGLFLSSFFEKNYSNIRATEKTMLILMISILFVKIGNFLHLASFLGIMAAGVFLLEKAKRVAYELSVKLSKIWIVAEIFLFVLIGLSVDINVAMNAGLKGILAISAGLIFRSLGVLIATAFSDLSFKEKLFCVIAYLPKATVQAALGSIPLSYGIAGGQIILSLAVLSILFTAPLGLIGIRYFGKTLLDLDFQEKDKENTSPVTEGVISE